VSDSPIRIAAVRRIGALSATVDSDLVAVEEPLAIEIEHGPAGARERLNAGVVLRTPGRDEDLATGLLFAEGFIRGRDEIASIDTPAPGHLRVTLQPGVEVPDRLARRVLVRTSACGLCGRDAVDDLLASGAAPLAAGPVIAEHTLRELPAALRARQQAFNETGGLHAAAFFDADGRLLSVAEDIGRHNAVDKLVGDHLRTAALAPAVLVVSGRAAFEIVQKAVRARVPILAAVGAPSSLAVDTARAFNLTLAGFLREDRFNVYSGFDRIV
jgi:FdhD protein